MSMDWIEEAMAALDEQGLQRRLRELGAPQGPVIELGGREVINFSSNDYLGLAADPRLARAVAATAARWGVGSGSSRLIAGNVAVLEKLEQALAEFMNVEAALVFPSGYHANLGAIMALAGPGDVIVSDELNHASIIDGCRLSRARVAVYEHANVDELDRLLDEASDAERKLVVTESVFSMEGDLAPLDQIVKVAREHDAMIMVDEAHALGVLGENGRGALESFGVQTNEVDAVMGTLGKALGSSGAFVCGSQRLRDWLVNRARTFVFTTGMAPPSAGAAIEALRIVRDEPDRRTHLLALADKLRAALTTMGRGTDNSIAAIVPIVIGDPEATMNACETLLERGLFVQGIRPPTVPAGTSRLRINLSAGHTEEQVDQLINAIEEIIT